MKQSILKTILICLIILFFIVLSILLGIILKFKNTSDIFLKEDLTCHFREEVYVSDFIQEINGELLMNHLIDTTVVGEQTVHLNYKNRYGYIMAVSFQIHVLDVTSPTIVVNNPYIVEKGSIDHLEETIFCADDYDDNVSCQLEGNYQLNKVGNYPLKITATDSSNNTTEKEFTLSIIEEQKKFSSNSKKSSTKFSDIYKKYKSIHTMIGLDLSKWQEEVDFQKIKEQGVEFVMLKIGGKTKIGGEITMDPMFLTNIKNAIEQNLEVGVYFYSYAANEKEVKEEAKWVINQLKDYNITLPIVFDWENWSRFTTFHISFHTLNKIAKTFMEEVEKNGYDSMLYSSKYYLENIWYQEEYTNWLAYYTTNNDYKGDYLMWQLANDGKIEGIDGSVDINVLYVNKRLSLST